jgi:hypothetical protein
MSSSTGYNCVCCGARHTFTLYVLAHRFEHLTHRCDCGALHDIYDGEATLQEMTEPRVTVWIPSSAGAPERHGFYHVRFPNGTEADRNWYWNGIAFLYDKDSPVSLGLSSIGAYRGLDREYK